MNQGDQTYQVAQVHFHWTTLERYGGSEHVLAGKYYPMEVTHACVLCCMAMQWHISHTPRFRLITTKGHFVHFNTKYGDLGGAVASGKKDALLVIGIFFSVSCSH